MYLIDSSVWIEYLRPKGSQNITNKVREILQAAQAVTCAIVVIEILRGAKSNNEYQVLRESLTSLPNIPINNKVVDIASKWAYTLDRKGKTLSTTDLLIASAATYGKSTLLHADSDFTIISSEFIFKEERLLI